MQMQRRVLRRRTHLTADWQLDVDCTTHRGAGVAPHQLAASLQMCANPIDRQQKQTLLFAKYKETLNQSLQLHKRTHTVIRLTFSVKHVLLFPSTDLCRLTLYIHNGAFNMSSFLY